MNDLFILTMDKFYVQHQPENQTISRQQMNVKDVTKDRGTVTSDKFCLVHFNVHNITTSIIVVFLPTILYDYWWNIIVSDFHKIMRSILIFSSVPSDFGKWSQFTIAHLLLTFFVPWIENILPSTLPLVSSQIKVK